MMPKDLSRFGGDGTTFHIKRHHHATARARQSRHTQQGGDVDNNGIESYTLFADRDCDTPAE